MIARVVASSAAFEVPALGPHPCLLAIHSLSDNNMSFESVKVRWLKKIKRYN